MLPFLVSVVHQYTLVAVAQQAGPLRRPPTQGLDPGVLVDAIAAIMAHEEKELCKARVAQHQGGKRKLAGSRPYLGLMSAGVVC